MGIFLRGSYLRLKVIFSLLPTKACGYNLDDENAGTSVDAARAVKGKLMPTTTIFDNLVVKGYDPKKIPGWVAWSDKNSPPPPPAVQSQSAAPVTSVTATASPAKAERSDTVPI
jgi:hypothetical protein